MDVDLLDGRELNRALDQLGQSFPRIVGYFREDGVHAVSTVERAMRGRDAAAIVTPAHRLKGEARQLGARLLGDLAERIEMTARLCIERRTGLEDMIAEVAELRPCFERTLEALARATYDRSRSLAGRGSAPGFGRKSFLSLLSRP